jgi:hypothetical protein
MPTSGSTDSLPPQTQSSEIMNLNSAADFLVVWPLTPKINSCAILTGNVHPLAVPCSRIIPVSDREKSRGKPVNFPDIARFRNRRRHSRRIVEPFVGSISENAGLRENAKPTLGPAADHWY